MSQNVHFITTVPLTRTGVLYPRMRDCSNTRLFFGQVFQKNLVKFFNQYLVKISVLRPGPSQGCLLGTLPTVGGGGVVFGGNGIGEEN